VSVAATDFRSLYTSATIRSPQGIVRDNGGQMVALQGSMARNLRHQMRARTGSTASRNVGWVVGHSYLVYAPLLKGCTTIMFGRQAGRNARWPACSGADLQAQGPGAG